MLIFFCTLELYPFCGGVPSVRNLFFCYPFPLMKELYVWLSPKNIKVGNTTNMINRIDKISSISRKIYPLNRLYSKVFYFLRPIKDRYKIVDIFNKVLSYLTGLIWIA